jgi:predicted nucleotidyltransferase
MSKAVVGIVAEYNPFHLGHLHHLEEIRKSLDVGTVIVVLSSYFTQRGEPALCSPASRSQMAILGGADIVIHLPTAFSCQSAGIFASAAVDALAATGIVTHISFGMESPQQDMAHILDILIHEPDAFKLALRRFLNEGLSFPQARSRAIATLCRPDDSFLAGPNNILALEYAKRIEECRYGIRLLPVARSGGGHKSTSLAEPIPSAGALRSALSRSGNLEALRSGVPDFSFSILAGENDNGRLFTSPETLWRLTRVILSRETPDSLRSFAGVTEGVENRILQWKERVSTFEDLVSACSSRRYPKSRIRRTIINILLGLDRHVDANFRKIGPRYLRILGFSENGRTELARMRRTATLPVLCRWTVRRDIDERSMLDFEHRASVFWEGLLLRPDFRSILREHP